MRWWVHSKPLQDGKKNCALRGGGDIKTFQLYICSSLVLELALELELVLALG